MNFPRKNAEYADLRELKEPWGVVYGPFQSRRLGLSLGINLLGSEKKICNFNCPYCELGKTELKMAEIKLTTNFIELSKLESELQDRISILLQNKTPPDFITFVGNGEPTLFPELNDAVNIVLQTRNRMSPTSQVGILTNGSTLDNSKVVQALNLLDERMIKLDAGSEQMLVKINGPLSRLTLRKVINGCSRLKDVTLQSFFVQGAIDNTVAAEIDEWIEVVGMIKPKLVHVYTLDRVPPTTGLIPVPKQRLKEIVEKLAKRTQVPALVFG